MEDKAEKRQIPEKQDGRSTTPPADNVPTPGQQAASADRTSEDGKHIPLNRPWTHRKRTINGTLKREHPLNAKSEKSDALERWSAEPMSDGPYQNVKSVVRKAQTKQPNTSNNQLLNQPPPISETAATSGSA
ncbi:hypothetical protein F5B19DRAFT_389211 [Rostrohypoxylon terebratum]|nr:hypothetical protein F5B19DRAFT_389211 [Rostrohypoxylon terebratum]